jgi:2-hydroxychromene-2-carboxylate isomerase
MGTVISLEQHRAKRARRAAAQPVRPRATLYFDLGSPYTYLAAERADRLFAGLDWRPASAAALYQGAPLRDDRAIAAAGARAALLRLPLVWPETGPGPVRGVPVAMRVAALAAESGRGPAFVLAASRLAFCGGFDLDEPEILAEAAAAAGLGLDAALEAAADVRRDAPIEEAGRRLLAQGADRLPVLRLGRTLFCGEDRLAEAAAAARTAV